MSFTHSGDVADIIAHTPQQPHAHPHPHPHPHPRRWAVALLLVSSALAACGDNPVAPNESVKMTDQINADMTASLISVTDDATGRLLMDGPGSSPLRSALQALRSALASHQVDVALRAVADAQLALEFSRAAQSMDASDRDALVLQLGVVHAQLAAEAR